MNKPGESFDNANKDAQLKSAEQNELLKGFEKK